ncbi:MAG: MFS transporter [Dehalococcoidia bacterium]|nr:MFS transporter [Dehalococcoidia bacterium]
MNDSSPRFQGRLFFGWIIVGLCTFILFLTWGGHYSFGVFLLPLTKYFDSSRTEISALVAVRGIISGVFCLGAGTLSDKYGIKKVVFVGVVLTGVGWFFSAFVSELWQVYLFYSVVGGLGMSAIYVPIVAVISRWFNAKRPLALGIVLSAFGIGQMLMPLIVSPLVASYGWQFAFMIVGLMILVFGVPSIFFLKSSPEEIGLTVDGAKVKVKENPSGPQVEAIAANNWTRKEASGTLPFWQLLVIYFSSALCFQIVIVHLVARAVDVGVEFTRAALIISITGAAGIAGRILTGAVAVKVGQKRAMSAALILQVPMFFLFIYARDVWVFYLFGAIFGISYAGVSPLVPALTAGFFGLRHFGAVFAVMNMAYAIGAALGPVLAAYVFDVAYDYRVAFMGAGVLLFCNFIISLFLKDPVRKAKHPD